MKTPEELREHLLRVGLVSTPTARLVPLSGGVSSDIWLVLDGETKFVVKRARPRLDVPGEWYADISRNRFEQEFMSYVAGFLPGAVPRVLHADAEHGFFTMEYLGAGFINWKSLLLQGQADPSHAVQAASILSAIHRHSWNDPEVGRRFASLRNFQQLRIDPYLVTAGRRHPPLQSHFEAEAERLAGTALCLVHGDFSPKNILIGPAAAVAASVRHHGASPWQAKSGRMVLLDCEVAWHGDPAFDVAFLLSHFFLKALLFSAAKGRRQPKSARPRPFLQLADVAWQTYQRPLPPQMVHGLEERTAALLLMLLLARIDGKSPVEYIKEEVKKDLVRAFVSRNLPNKTWKIGELAQVWQDRLAGS